MFNHLHIFIGIIRDKRIIFLFRKANITISPIRAWESAFCPSYMNARIALSTVPISCLVSSAIISAESGDISFKSSFPLCCKDFRYRLSRIFTYKMPS